MNEFIVWDGKKNEWAKDTYRFVIDVNGALYVRTKTVVLEHQNVENRYKAFNYIGKTDINGKKIYADSSIVEFGYDNTNRYYDRVQGYFYQDEWQIRLKVTKSEDCVGVDNLPMTYQNPKDLKVIGNLQENPELLGENK